MMARFLSFPYLIHGHRIKGKVRTARVSIGKESPDPESVPGSGVSIPERLLIGNRDTIFTISIYWFGKVITDKCWKEKIVKPEQNINQKRARALTYSTC